MAAPRGHPRYGGRAAGTPNKVTIAKMIRGALSADDPAAYLSQQARENPRVYVKLLGRVLADEMSERDAGRTVRDG